MPSFQFLLFVLVLNLILAAINLRAYRWFVEAFAPAPWLRRFVAGLLGASLLTTFAGRLVSRAGYELAVPGLFVLAFAVQLAALISVALLLCLDLWRLLRRLGRFALAFRRTIDSQRAVQPEPEQKPAPAPEVAVSRRHFALQAAVGSTFLIGGSSSVYGSLLGRHDYVIEDVPIAIPGLSRAFDGFSIVQLSDIHIGQFVGEPELRAAETLVRQAAPDLIVLTGDLLDHDPRFAEHLGRFVRRLEPLARHGVCVVSGNHDFYAGITPTVSALEAGGARVLRNQGIVLGDASAGIALLGVDDVRGARFEPHAGPDLTRALASLPTMAGRVSPALDLPRVLLCHNPSYFEHAQERVDLQLSGHTHGGQVNLLVRPADWVFPHGWIAGLYREGSSRLYVNRGFGTAGPPARVGAPPEVSRIVLTV